MDAIIHHPPTIINAYLASKINPDFELDMESLTLSDPPVSGSRSIGTTYFFPTLPTEIDALTETFPQSNGVFGVYDRMFKMRRMPFPHIKCEQLLYYFNALEENAVPNLIRITQRIQDLLDNGDESAEDINSWILSIFEIEEVLDGDRKRPMAVVPGHGTFYVPHFHNFKIYQLEETRDIIDFGTARTYAGNKIIIDYDWHSVYSKNT